ncbi:MAG: hypothetical protein HC780_03480 [Leptolyngbyaceae cyanobacterium CSU_1_3]|nr:hypothetical protein [Leptolyngbyaceae cyanobacterium CSU_1_3]
MNKDCEHPPRNTPVASSRNTPNLFSGDRSPLDRDSPQSQTVDAKL